MLSINSLSSLSALAQVDAHALWGGKLIAE